MKTKFLSIAVILFSAIILVACGKIEKVLVKKDGLWNVASMMQKVTMGGTVIMDTTIADWGTITFTDDGKGTMTPKDTATWGAASTFSWSADQDEETVTIITGTSPNMDTTVYDVVESSAKEQSWSNSTTDTTGGVTTVMEGSMDLDRP